jgi:hypothetical protein
MKLESYRYSEVFSENASYKAICGEFQSTFLPHVKMVAVFTPPGFDYFRNLDQGLADCHNLPLLNASLIMLYMKIR